MPHGVQVQVLSRAPEIVIYNDKQYGEDCEVLESVDGGECF